MNSPTDEDTPYTPDSSIGEDEYDPVFNHNYRFLYTLSETIGIEEPEDLAQADEFTEFPPELLMDYDAQIRRLVSEDIIHYDRSYRLTLDSRNIIVRLVLIHILFRYELFETAPIRRLVENFRSKTITLLNFMCQLIYSYHVWNKYVLHHIRSLRSLRRHPLYDPSLIRSMIPDIRFIPYLNSITGLCIPDLPLYGSTEDKLREIFEWEVEQTLNLSDESDLYRLTFKYLYSELFSDLYPDLERIAQRQDIDLVFY